MKLFPRLATSPRSATFPRLAAVPRSAASPATAIVATIGAAALLLSGCAAESGNSSSADSGAGSAGSTGVVSSGADSTGSATSYTVGLSYIPNVQFAPVYLAAERGALPGATVRHHVQSEGLFQALIAGTEDIVVAGADEAAAAADSSLLVVAPYYQQFPVVLVVPEDSPIKSLADLPGKKVGIPGSYGETSYGYRAGLQAAGVDLGSVDLQEIGYTQVAALTTGKVDAVVGFVNNDAVQAELAGLKVRTIPLGTDTGLRSASIVTRKEFAAAHPEVLRQFVGAMFESYDALRTNPEAGVDAAVSLVPNLGDPEQRAAAEQTIKATVGLLPKAGDCETLTAEAGKALIDTLNGIDVDTHGRDGSQIYTTEFCS